MPDLKGHAVFRLLSTAEKRLVSPLTLTCGHPGRLISARKATTRRPGGAERFEDVLDESHKYRTALEELESTVKSVETGDLDVDQLPLQIARAVKLIAFCKASISDAELEVNGLLGVPSMALFVGKKKAVCRRVVAAVFLARPLIPQPPPRIRR